jgi:hypothetical protein
VRQRVSGRIFDRAFFLHPTFSETRCTDLVTAPKALIPRPLRVCVVRVTPVAMTRRATRGALPPASKADSAPSEQEQDEGSERHPESRARIGVLLHRVEVVGLFADVDVERDIDGECDEGEEGGEEGDKGGDEGHCDVFGEGEEESDEDEDGCDGVEDEATRPGGADGLGIVSSTDLGEL